MTGPDRALDAEAFLREAVYRSRGSQALSGGLAAGEAPGGCGLGEKAAVVLDLDAKGRALFERLWPAGLSEPALERVRELMRGWVREQDGLDRKRNHFLKAFRNEHGFDRTAYTAEQQAAYDAGLERVNAEANRRQAEVAAELLAVG